MLDINRCFINSLFKSYLLFQLVALHGLEADRHLLRCLFSCVEFPEPSSKISAPSVHSQLLLSQIAALLNKPSLASSICYVIDHPLSINKVKIYHFLYFLVYSSLINLNINTYFYYEIIEFFFFLIVSLRKNMI